jgi:hypothetical protein
VTTQLDPIQTVPQPALQSGTSKRTKITAASAAVGVVALGLGGFVYVNRTISTTVTSRLTSSAIPAGSAVVLTGTIAPKADSRELDLQASSDKGATWQQVERVTTGANSGIFTISYKPTVDTGDVLVRVVAPKSRHLGERVGPSLAVTVLARSTVNAVVPNFVARGRSVTVSGTVQPPEAARSVKLEESSDGTTWVDSGVSGETTRSGRYALTTRASDAGPWQFRVAVAADSRYAASQSAAQGVIVEDVKAAGAFYLRTVKVPNAALGKWNDLIDAYDAGNATLTQVQDTLAKFARAERTWANQITGYSTWPHNVQPLIKKLVSAITVEYGALNSAAVAKNLMDYNLEVDRSGITADHAGGFAEQVRQQLGLPARS